MKGLNTSIILAIIFALMLVLYAIYGYTYLYHLLVEQAIVISYVVGAVLLLFLPKSKYTNWHTTFGTLLLITAFLEFVHSIYYPGYFTDDPTKAVLFWMAARGVFSFTMPIIMVNRKEEEPLSKGKIYAVSFVTLAFLLMVIFRAGGLFYKEGKTTLLKSTLEVVYFLALTISSFWIKKDALLKTSFLFSGLSELWFLKYGSNVYTFQFVLGHVFALIGAISLGLWIENDLIYTPYKRLCELSKRYKIDLKNLKETIEEKISQLEFNNQALSLLIDDKTIEEVQNSLRKLAGKFRFGKDSAIVLFYRNKPLYKSDESLKDGMFTYLKNGWDSIASGSLTLFYRNVDEEKLKIVLEWVRLKVEEIELRERVEKSKEDIKDIDNYRKNFMRTIVHEMKTPLNAIFGQLQLLDMGVYGDVSNIKEALKDLKESASRLFQLVNMILEYTKIQEGKYSLKWEQISFSAFKDLIEEYKALAKGKRLAFTFEFEGREPFFFDFNVLSVIVSNLLSNAVKYTKNGFIKGYLKVESSYIEIVVKDSGVGIPKDEIDKIFEPFYSKSQLDEISGMGLALVKEFVKMLNGRIEVDSEVGKGTQFTIELPALYRPKEYKLKEHVHVVIVDEDEETKERISKNLIGSFIKAENVIEGYLKVLEHTPDIVFVSLDISTVPIPLVIKTIRSDARLGSIKFAFYSFVKDDGKKLSEKIRRDLADFFGRRILIVQDLKGSRLCGHVCKTLELMGREIYNIVNYDNLLEEEIGIYDSFVLLFSRDNLKDAMITAEEIASFKPSGTLVSAFLLEEG